MTIDNDDDMLLYTFGLKICIGGDWYGLRIIPPDDRSECIVRYTIIKDDDSQYHVTVRTDGIVVCECADYTFKREQLDPLGCKHIQALKRYGLLGFP